MAKKKARAQRRTARAAQARRQDIPMFLAQEDWMASLREMFPDDSDEELAAMLAEAADEDAQEMLPDELTIDRLWMEILPPDQCGADPCNGGWSDPTPHWCRQPTQYALCGTYVEFEGPVNSWYYCAQHAEAYAAQAGLPWPPTQHWQ
jgi:hypothetical protein